MQQRPYVVQGNKLGPKAYEGWVRFSAFCERCHGPGGIGSAQAPDLTAAVKGLTKPQFEHIVRCGLTGNIGLGVMPPWGDDPNIAPYLDGAICKHGPMARSAWGDRRSWRPLSGENTNAWPCRAKGL